MSTSRSLVTRLLYAASPLIFASLATASSIQIHPTQLISPTASKVSITGFPTGSALGRTDQPTSIHAILPDGSSCQFEVRPSSTLTPDVKWIEMRNGQPLELPITQLSVFVGEDPAVAGSFCFFAIDSRGRMNGLIDYPSGYDWSIGTVPDLSSTYITAVGGDDQLPDAASFCGLVDAVAPQLPRAEAQASTLSARGPWLARVAIDTDSSFAAIFPTTGDAASYVAQVIAAVNAIYLRDLDVRLALGQVRIFTGTTPFSADDVGGFADYWGANEDTSLFDVVHLFSARRDLPYGGIAFLSGVCSGAFGVDAALNGSFPTPLPSSSKYAWDVLVTAHEMGHNFGSLHTHDDQYDPLIDSCAFGYPMVGTIMSYCHTTPGGALNTDLIMHRRVNEVIRNRTAFDGCLPFDCNGNNVNDSIDLSLGVSLDLNNDAIPDECQDCNGNLVLDPDDILGGMADVNANGVLDVCETDCNSNTLPDAYEIFLGMEPDDDGNDRPDQTCDPHCSNPLIADHRLLGDSLANDLNRNRIPDNCAAEDCDQNSIPDWVDMEQQGFLLTSHSDFAGLFSFHGQSGVVSGFDSIGASPIQAVDIFPDRRRLTLHTNGQLIASRPGEPESLLGTFTGATDMQVVNNLIVIGDSTAGGTLRALHPSSGAQLASLAINFLGSPEVPLSLAASPTGTLFAVTSQNNILEFFVTATSIGWNNSTYLFAAAAGPLLSPRALAVQSDSRIFVYSAGSDQILEYNAGSHTFTGSFVNGSGLTQGITSLAIGPDGNLFAARTATPRIVEYALQSGLAISSFARGVQPLATVTDMVFLPPSEFDCNQNGRFDLCDIADGLVSDSNSNSIPDSCEIVVECCIGTSGNVDCLGNVDIADLTLLVDHLFIANTPLCCRGEANVNAVGEVDISDVLYLVDHLFINSPTLPACP